MSVTSPPSIAAKGAQRFLPRARPAAEVGVGIRPRQISGIEKVLDFVSRPEYAVAGAFRQIWRGNFEDIGEALAKGIQARRRISFMDIARDEFNLDADPFFEIPDFKLVPDVLEAIVENIMSPAGLVGFSMGVALDPLSYIGIGFLTKAGKLGRLARGGVGKGVKIVGGKLEFAESPLIKAGSRQARQWERAFEKTGKLPEDLAATWAEQAALGQRSALQITTPWGEPLFELWRGQPFFRVSTKIGDIVRKTPALKSVMQIFTHFNIPPEFLDLAAERRAVMRVTAQVVEKRARNFYKLIDDSPELKRLGRKGPKRRRAAVAEIRRESEDRYRMGAGRIGHAAGTAELPDRLLGTARLIESALAGGATTDARLIREALDMPVDAPLFQRLSSGADPLSEFEKFRADADFVGIEYRGAFTDSELGEDVVRILIDRDLSPTSETIAAAMNNVRDMIRGTTDQTEAGRLFESMRNLERALGFVDEVPQNARIWRMIAFDDAGKPTNVGRAASLEELRSQLSPALEGAQFERSLVRMTPQYHEAMLRRHAGKPQLKVVLDERARLASRVEESVQALTPRVMRALELPEEEAAKEAYKLLLQNLDQDLIRLERIDRTIEQLAVSRQTVRQTRARPLVDLPGQTALVDEMLRQGKFSNLDNTLKIVGLDLEEMMDITASVEQARGLLRSRRPAYLNHILADELSLFRSIANFGKQPMRADLKLPSSKQRTIEFSIDQVNLDRNREYFLEDIITGAAFRVTQSAKGVSYHDFIHRTLEQFGERIHTGGDVARIKNALDPRFGIYQPKGPLSWYPTNVLSDSALQRGITRGEELVELGRKPKRGQELVELDLESVRRGFGISKNAPAYVVPREIAEHLNRVEGFNGAPAGLQVMGRLVADFRGLWSKWTLFFFPGYITRNIAGNIANALYAGLRNPLRYHDAQQIQRGKKWSATTAGGRVIDDQYVLDHAIRTGTVDSGWAMNEAIAHAGGLATREDQIIKRFQREGLTGAKRLLAELEEPGVMRMMMRVNGWMENNAKLGLFIDRLIKGDTPELAARTVRKYLFDYDELRPTEVFLKTFIMPYYTWSRKNLSLQFEQLIKRPGDFAKLARTIRLIEASSEPRQETLPQWMHESMPIRLSSDEGRGKFEYFVLRNWLPAAELQTLFSPAHSLASMMAPWLRLPVENANNYSFYFRRPIEAYAGQRGIFLGMELKRKDIELARVVRLASEIDRVLPAPADSPLAGFQAPFWDRITQFLTGLKVFEVDVRRQRSIALGQQKRILRELRSDMNRARRRRDIRAVRDIQELMRLEERRKPDVVLPLSITGLPTEP